MRTFAHVRAALLLAACFPFLASSARAGDVTWNPSFGSTTWDTVAANWNAGNPFNDEWNNAAGDGAVFGGFGVGTVNVTTGINVRSLDFQAGGYTLNGPSTLTFVSNGTSTVPAGAVRVGTGLTATINGPMTTAIGLRKLGGGTLQLGGPVTFTGTAAYNGGTAHLVIDDGAGVSVPGTVGTVQLTAANVLPTTASVAIGSGFLNIGNFNTTLGSLTYINTVASAAYGANGNNGVYGTGTLKVTGAITSLYTLGTSGQSNTLAANLDMNGGTQQFFTNTVPTALGYTGLHVTGVLSNGALFKSSTSAQAGGIGLYANNTYTGATTIVGSFGGGFTTGAFGNVVAGTNASTAFTSVGGFVTLYGANGSYGSAATVNLIGGGALSLDNNSTTNGTNSPVVAQGNNGNRLSDTAAVTLSHGTLQLISQSAAASSETVGSLTTPRGFNTVTATATGTGGAATLTVAGDWTRGAADVMQFRGTTLGGSSKILVNGAVPPAVGGILTRAYGVNTAPAETGFVKYDPTNGVTLLTAGEYQTAFGSDGNVTIAADAGPIDTQTINALRATATATVSFNAGAVLTVTSGQILATTGTLTLDATTPNGSLVVGVAPATFLAATGTITNNAPIVGTGGLIKSGTGTLNVNGSLGGLSGTFTHHAGTTTLNTPYLNGDIEVLSGTFNLRSNLTGGGQTITLGNPDTPANTIGQSVSFNIQSTAVTTIAGSLVVSNGSTDPTATLVNISQLGGTNGIVQEFGGSVTLNSTLNILGGGNTTNTILFSGALSGNGAFRVQNGRVRFTGASNYNGPFILGNGGNTTNVSFDGTNSSATGTVTAGPGTGVVTSTTVRFSAGNAMPGGLITLNGAVLQPTATVTLPNAIAVAANSNFDVGAGLSPTFAGVVSGTAGITKTGAGTLILSNAGNTNTGAVAVNAGTLQVDGRVAGSTNAVTVAGGASLGGNGAVGTTTTARNVTVAAGGAINPGSAGTAGTLTVHGTTTVTAAAPGTGATLVVDATRSGVGTISANDKLAYNGALNFAGLATGTPTPADNKFRIMVVGDPNAPLEPMEAYTITIAQLAAGGSGQIRRNGTQVNGTTYTFDPNDYELVSPHFTIFQSVSLVANTNGTLVLTFTPVPEPGTVLGVAALGLGVVCLIRRRFAKRAAAEQPVTA